jgi:UDPglucose 6-dehydrogenase
MRIAVIGTGYAGLVTAVGLAELGHSVVGLDVSATRIALLREGTSPIFEPGLEPLLRRGLQSGRLTFTDSYTDLSVGSGIAFLVVGSPGRDDGSVDLSSLFDALHRVLPSVSDGATLVVKSTVPVGTARTVEREVAAIRPDVDLDVVSNPEFLRQGAAVADFLSPDRVVIGSRTERGRATMHEVYQPLIREGSHVVSTTPESAELIKYASNSYLALRLSFINEISDLAEACGAAMDDVARGIGLDSRIGDSYLRPGPGFGGSCLPKDTEGLLHTLRDFGTESRILEAVLEVNSSRVPRLVDRIESSMGGTLVGASVAVLGITFKAGTDDVRDSPAVRVVRELVARGASVRVFDPRGMETARIELGDAVEYGSDEYATVRGSDVCVIATEWRQFASLSLPRLAELMASPVVVDLRAMWDPAHMEEAGIRYFSVGRPDPA